MRSTTRVVALCLGASLALLATSAPAAAKPKPITGKLNKAGYTVIALAANGRATSVRAGHGSFRLVPPAKRVTLQLRAKDGTYAGPVVVGRERHGKRAIVGVLAGAKLGDIEVKPAKGYANARRLRPRWLDASRWARARGGVPIGNGRNSGFVSSPPPRRPPPGDRDADGVPDALDIAASGDLILNNFKRSQRARAARTASSADPCAAPCAPDVGLASILNLNIDQTVNANAAALTVHDIDAALSEFGFLRVGYPHDATTELDCGGLVYCSRGGTGRVGFTGPAAAVSAGAPFPSCCDPDGDGFGTMNLASFDPGAEGHPAQFFLAHHATTAQIGSRDVLIERATVGSVESQCSPAGPTTCFPVTLQDVFATVPALVSYDDGVKNSPTVSYPVAPSTPGCPPPGCPPGGRGTFGNGFPVAARANGDVVLRLTFWRPQRRAIAGETGKWTDIGGLTYAVPRIINPELPGPEQFPGAGCPPGSYSTTDPDLAPNTAGALTDSAPDRPANAANTITYTLNVSQCLATTGLAWNQGHEMQFFFDADNRKDSVEQTVIFRRQ